MDERIEYLTQKELNELLLYKIEKLEKELEALRSSLNENVEELYVLSSDEELSDVDALDI